MELVKKQLFITKVFLQVLNFTFFLLRTYVVLVIITKMFEMK
jgi:hypothetical protein